MWDEIQNTPASKFYAESKLHFSTMTNLGSFRRRLRMPCRNHLEAYYNVMFCVGVVKFDGKSMTSSN